LRESRRGALGGSIPAPEMGLLEGASMRMAMYLNPQTPSSDDDGRIINEVLGQLDLGQALGFEDVWLTDHQFTGYNAFSDPLVMAGAVSQRNPGLNIGFSVVVAPLRHPVQFVTQCNLIDQLSNGRLIVGIGAGNSVDEFAGYGLTTSNRHDRMREFVDVCEAAWTAPESGFAFEGEHFTGKVRGRIIPKAVQKKPHIAYATSTPATLEYIGKKGWSLLAGPQKPEVIAGRLFYYLRGMEAAGHSQEHRELMWRHSGVLRQLYVAAPGEDWRDTINEYMETYLRKSAHANTGIDDLPKDDLNKRMGGYIGNWLYAGTPDELIEMLAPFARLGFGHVMTWFAFGHMPDALVRQSIERFAKHVGPALREIKRDDARLDEIQRGINIVMPEKAWQERAAAEGFANPKATAIP
jgi:alkanesulfonate monooxygenase SsuD/methylene tetrahydromethanopterin reductase-like flavin-dependent oxidoreductase (luciferase family)